MNKYKNQVVYYPIFEDGYELSSHYYRACWYLPNQDNHLEGVYLFKNNCDIIDNIEYMGQKTVSTGHIHIMDNLQNYDRVLEESYVILCWIDYDREKAEKWRNVGKVVINVDTYDVTSKEYGAYCGIIWKYFKTNDEKQMIIDNHHVKFNEAIEKIKKENCKVSCVFGTGPSLDRAWDYNFEKCACIVCNSIVQNKLLLDHIRPKFLTAGDVVSHLGVSKYAEVFRADLINYILENETLFLTTAAFGYLLHEQCPDIRDKMLLVEQKMDIQNMDLCQQYQLPRLDSTLNIHMLPIANTISNHIIISGCDGKIPNKDNEDFWAHSETSQYHDLVDTGHMCHPTFDVHRQQKTYAGYKESVKLSLQMGEENGKTYRTLLPSFVEGLQGREIDHDLNFQYDEENRLIIAKLYDDIC